MAGTPPPPCTMWGTLKKSLLWRTNQCTHTIIIRRTELRGVVGILWGLLLLLLVQHIDCCNISPQRLPYARPQCLRRGVPATCYIIRALKSAWSIRGRDVRNDNGKRFLSFATNCNKSALTYLVHVFQHRARVCGIYIAYQVGTTWCTQRHQPE